MAPDKSDDLRRWRCGVRPVRWHRMSSGGGSPWLSAPTWTVDAGRFRDTCDRLRAALAAPVMPRSDAAGQALGHDRAAIATSLRDVLAAVDGVDLEAVRARSSMVKEFRSTEHAQRLGGLMSTLEGALQRYVASVLGPTKTRVIKRLLGSPAPDVLRILGREDHENSHSDLIAWLLSPRRAPVVALHALRRLTSRMGNAGRWAEVLADAVADEAVSVRREFVLHGRDAVEQRRICSVPRKSRHSCARDSGGASARVGGHAATRRGAASRLARRSLGVCQPSA